MLCRFNSLFKESIHSKLSNPKTPLQPKLHLHSTESGHPKKNKYPTYQSVTLKKYPHFNAEKIKYQFISSEKYNSLTDTDKKTLDTILFTNLGYYALSKNYINVNQFLGLSLDARIQLKKLFYPASEMTDQASKCRKKIDTIFNNRFLDLNQFEKLLKRERKMLLQFLNLPNQIGLKFLKCTPCYTLNNYLLFTEDQQENIFRTIQENYNNKGVDYANQRTKRNKRQGKQGCAYSKRCKAACFQRA